MRQLITVIGYLCILLALITSIMGTAVSLMIQLLGLGLLLIVGAEFAKRSRNNGRED